MSDASERRIDLSPLEFKARVDDGELWLLLDVREPWERDVAAVADTRNIAMGDIPTHREELSQHARIAVMCHGGVRSARVADWLVAELDATVANLSGGIDAWSQTIDPSIPRY